MNIFLAGKRSVWRYRRSYPIQEDRFYPYVFSCALCGNTTSSLLEKIYFYHIRSISSHQFSAHFPLRKMLCSHAAPIGCYVKRSALCPLQLMCSHVPYVVIQQAACWRKSFFTTSEALVHISFQRIFLCGKCSARMQLQLAVM